MTLELVSESERINAQQTLDQRALVLRNPLNACQSSATSEENFCYHKGYSYHKGYKGMAFPGPEALHENHGVNQKEVLSSVSDIFTPVETEETEKNAHFSAKRPQAVTQEGRGTGTKTHSSIIGLSSSSKESPATTDVLPPSEGQSMPVGENKKIIVERSTRIEKSTINTLSYENFFEQSLLKKSDIKKSDIKKHRHKTSASAVGTNVSKRKNVASNLFGSFSREQNSSSTPVTVTSLDHYNRSSSNARQCLLKKSFNVHDSSVERDMQEKPVLFSMAQDLNARHKARLAQTRYWRLLFREVETAIILLKKRTLETRNLKAAATALEQKHKKKDRVLREIMILHLKEAQKIANLRREHAEQRAALSRMTTDSVESQQRILKWAVGSAKKIIEIATTENSDYVPPRRFRK